MKGAICIISVIRIQNSPAVCSFNWHNTDWQTAKGTGAKK